MMKSPCLHHQRKRDLYNGYELTPHTAKLIVPNWCAHCECDDDDTSDYKETPIYYKTKDYETDPHTDFLHNPFKLDEFFEMEREDDDFDPDNIQRDLEVSFESFHPQLFYDTVKLTIIYQRCSKEEYNHLRRGKENESTG